MDGEVNFAEGCAAFFNDCFQAARLGDVEFFKKRCANGFSQWLGVFGGFVVLVGQGDFATEITDRLGDGKGNRLVVGDTGDQALFASQRQVGGGILEGR